jgi:predicted acyl esterase
VSLLLGGGVAATVASAAPASAPVAHGSVEQVYATGLPGGAKLALLDHAGHRIATKSADSLGGVVFYNVKPGAGYRVQVLPHGRRSAAVTVHTTASTPWTTSYYHQPIADDGYQYLTTRDGTKLAIDVHPPTVPAGIGTPDVTLPSGLPEYAPPYPTLIEYSGYGYADPSAPQSSIAAIANALGFAVVDVNMRGTGCSGGAFNFFEPLQDLDGYDVIETIAHQPWVKDHKVGMMGISYGGISQLFTAQTRPPDLEAIAPLSVIDATATTLYPGGILNTGFALGWALERAHDAEPAGPKTGQSWAWTQIKNGDAVCKQNQVLHGEAEDLLAKVKANSHYHPSVADPLDPVTFVNKIDVPVFMACQWTDEQTGGHCPALASRFTGTKHKWFTFTNGAHIDSLDPYTYDRWYDFLSIYVNHQPPAENAAVAEATSPVVYNQAMGIATDDVVTLPPDPLWQQPSLAAAKAAFEALPSIRILFDNGAGASPTQQAIAGAPYPGFEQSFTKWPVPGTTAKTWYIGAKGALTTQRASRAGVNWYTSDPHELPATDFDGPTEGGGLWGNATQWHWNWQPHSAGKAVSYLTAPLARNTAVIGAGAVRLYLKSSTPDVDLEATISEVDPDGTETLVQSGYLRASDRTLSTTTNNVMHARSTAIDPVPSLRPDDVAPMPHGRFVPVVIPLYYEAHVFRAGTRIRVTVSAPNGTAPIWSFDQTQPATGTARVSVAFGPSAPSSLVLPVVARVAVPTGIPPCGSLRDEPCRTYLPTPNRVSK